MASRTVKNKGVGATLKLDIDGAVKSLKELAKQLTETGTTIDALKNQTIKLEVDVKPFQGLQKAAKDTTEAINKAFVDSSKKVQAAMSQNMITTPTSPDYLNKLRENMRQAQDIVATATAKMQTNLASAFNTAGITPTNLPILSEIAATGRAFSALRTDYDSLFNHIGKQDWNLPESIKASAYAMPAGVMVDSGVYNVLSEKELKGVLQSAQGFELLQSAAKAVDTGQIAQIGRSLETLNAIDTSNIARIGEAFDTLDFASAVNVGQQLNTMGELMDGVDTMKMVEIGQQLEYINEVADGADAVELLQVGEALQKVADVSDTLDFADLVQTLGAIDRMDTLVNMAEQANKARENMVKLSNVVSGVGNAMQSLGSGIGKLGNAIQNYSNYMIKGFMALQYTLRGVIDTAVGGASSLISDSIEQIKELEGAQIGFQNYFATKEEGFDSDLFLKRIQQEAVRAQGVNAGDLAAYISQVAPVAESSDQAFDVTMGLLKAIAYSGGNASTEMNNVVRNIRDVLAKGKAYAMDINQFNRAIPGLPNILSQMGLDQFLDNGQLSITKDNVGQVMAAFATFNSPDSPVYDILEKMSETLGGRQEMTKETIIQSISSSLQTSGLLQIWKDMLGNVELQTYIEKGIDTLLRSVADFLNEVGIEHLITSVLDVFGRLGEYFGETVVPALKTLFGLDQGVSIKEVVDNVINVLFEFGKGLIQGIKFLVEAATWIKNNIIPVIKNIGEALGLSGDSLAEWAGFFVTAAPLLAPLLKVVGALTSAFGKLLVKVSEAAIKKLFTSESETLFSNSKITQLLNGMFGKVLNNTSASAILKGLGITGIGHSISGIVGSLFGGTDTTMGKLAQEATNLTSTFIGVATAINPIAGAAAAAVEGLFAVSNAQKEYAAQLEQEKHDAMKESFDKLQNFYLNSAMESLRSAGIYHEGEVASQEGYNAVIEYLDEHKYDSTIDPQTIMNDIINIYKEAWALWKAGDNMLDTVENEIDSIGTTKIDKSNAAQYGDKIMAAYEKLLELGFIAMYDKTMENVDSYDLWKYLNENAQQFNSAEFLNQFYEHLNDPDWIVENLKATEVPIKFKAEGTDDLFDSFEEAAEAAGFHKVDLEDGRVAWQDDASFKIYVDIDQAKEAFNEYKQMQQELLKTPSTILDPNSPLLEFRGAVNDPGTKAEKYDNLSENSPKKFTWDDFWNSILPWGKVTIEKKAAGGYVRPIYKSVGGTFARGVDTIPAMLAPGEFVQRSSAVSLAGLGVMEALNHGDLDTAYRLLGAKLNHNVTNNTYGAVSNSDSHNQTTNFVTNVFRGRSGFVAGMQRLGTHLTHR